MPPKIRFEKQTIINAGFDIVRFEGEDKLNVRNTAKKLGCSTQPVMSHFSTIDELKREVCIMAENFHTDYLSDITGSMKDILLNLGMRYIRFAYDEKNLFRFIFLSGHSSGSILNDIIHGEEQSPVIDLLKVTLRLDSEKCKKAFMILYMFVHGYAVMIAQDMTVFDEDKIRSELELSLQGIRNELQKSTNQRTD